MSDVPEDAPKEKSGWSVALNGTITAHSLLSALLAIPGFLLICQSDGFKTDGSRIVALTVGSLLLITVAAIALRIIWRQAVRTDGTPPSITIQTGQDKKIVLNNPPDNLVTQEAMRGLLRAISVGYDPNLCPDGKVIGNASDGNVVPMTEEEKRDYIASHQSEITGKRKKAHEAALAPCILDTGH